MPALQVKECSEDVYERLRACAANENRSIAQQTLTIIQDYLNALDEPLAQTTGRKRTAASMPKAELFRPAPSAKQRSQALAPPRPIQ